MTLDFILLFYLEISLRDTFHEKEKKSPKLTYNAHASM